MAWFVLSTLIRWLVIYPLDSVIRPLNNRGLDNERYCESEMSCPRTQHNVPGQDSNLDHSSALTMKATLPPQGTGSFKLCSWARHFSFAVPLYAQVYK